MKLITKKCHFFFMAIFLLCFSAFVQAQKGTISGTIKNEKGEPVENTSIIIKGTNIGTKTDATGKYSISIAPGKHTIVISNVGFESIEKNVMVNENENTTFSPSLSIKGTSTELVSVVGSRSMKPRSLVNSPAPVDIIPVSQIANNVGQIDLNQILNFVAPSFQSAKQTISDGTDHVDPAQLRGLGTDQVLVLVNGKRRHQSALVNVNGTVNRGQVGTDMSAIPVNAVERIEVLRDGAAAQYGSDAIAGVINIVLKKTVNYLDGNVSYGMLNTKYDKNYALYKLQGKSDDPSVRVTDGQTMQGSVNFGFPIQKGFLNLTGEYSKKEETNRGGTYTGPVFANVNGVNKDDSIMAARGVDRNTFDMRIGNSRLQAASGMYNFSYPLKDGKSEVYSFGGYSSKKGNAAGFYRYPSSISGTGGSGAFAGTVFSIYPNGFLPEIETSINDVSVAVGFKTIVNNWNFDFSNTYGQNKFDFDILNSVNYSQAAISTTPKLNFDAGGLKFTQNTVNMDLSKKFSVLEGYSFAMGAEFRNEGFQIRNGEAASIDDFNGTTAPAGGSQVFAGFYTPNNKKQLRQSIGFYIDNELDITKSLLVTGALRFENYSDFGSALNYKVSSRLKVTDNINLRASTSTGFRAPSMQQRFYTKTNTLFVSNGIGLVPVESGTFTNDSKAANILGIPELKQETSRSYSVGLTAKLFKGFDATIDAYTTRIKNRIVLTNNFTSGGNVDLANQLAAIGANTANFFTNAIDTRATGLEMVLGYNTRIKKEHSLRTTFAAAFIKNEVEKDANGAPIIKASPTLVATNQIGNYFNREDQSRIEVANPIRKISLTFDYKFKKFTAMLRFVNFGNVTYLDPTINPNNPGAFPINAFTGNRETLDQEFGAKTVTDLSLGYKITKETSLTIGANNLFDVYQDRHTHSGNMSLGRFVYSRRVQQMGFNGAYFFARLRVGLATK